MSDAPQAPLVRLVDDDADLLAAQVQSLRIAGFTAEPFASAPDALRGLTRDYPGVVLTDVRMPGMDGLELLARLRVLDPDLPVILLTGHGDVPMAVQALKDGAWDFLTKPVGVDDLISTLRRASAARALVIENRMLRQMQTARDSGPQLLGESPAMVRLRETALRVAEAGADALILGPSGAGKEALARVMHRASSRRARPFLHVNCAAIDEARFEAEFLGAEAVAGRPRRPGRLEKAHRGTLFLDEVEALSPALQARILALIDSAELWVPGAEQARPLDLRVIGATQADLAVRVSEGRFRADLYYRLSPVSLTLPPLVARREDVPLLFRHFLLSACARLKVPVPVLTPGVKARLAAHDWPGNVRELQQFAERHALGLADDAGEEGVQQSLADMTAAYEAEVIRDALRIARGNVTAAMARLQVPRKTFYDKLMRHGIRAKDYRR